MPKLLGIISRLYAQPLVQGLPGGSRDDSFAQLIEDTPEHMAQRLREMELHGALLSPFDYASHYAHLQILSGVGISSKGKSDAIDLVFKEGLRRFDTVAVDFSFSSEIVLARLILAEKYEMTPRLIPRQDSLDQSLATADAVLVVDREAISGQLPANRIDLVEEWSDLTELPYVHAFWALNEDTFSIEERHLLRKYSLEGTKSVDPVYDRPEYLRQFRFELDDAAIAGLTEYFRMAYYYGMLKEIPDVKFAPAS